MTSTQAPVSDLDIARAARIRPIEEIAAAAGIPDGIIGQDRWNSMSLSGPLPGRELMSDAVDGFKNPAFP